MIYAIWAIVIVLVAQFFWLMRIEEVLEENGFTTDTTTPECCKSAETECKCKDYI